MLVNSMWEATANERPSYPKLQGDVHCDVVVIGGGYTGLSAAYHLQEHNVKTVVLEMSRVGSGASGRNGGEVLTGYLGPMEKWAEKKDIGAAREMWKLSIDSIDLIEDIIQKENIACDFVRQGHFNAAYKKSHLAGMRRNQEYMAKHFNYDDIFIVEPEDVKSELNTDFYHGGEVDKQSAHFHPLNYALGLAEAAVKRGATIFEHSNAEKIKWKGKDKAIVHTESGRVIANDVIFATNAYAGDVNKTIKKSVVPVESIMIATEPLTEAEMNDIIPNNRAIFDSKNLLYYFRRTGDHRLGFGGSGRASTSKGLEKMYANLHKGMLEVFPQLKDAKIEYNWGGKVGMTQSLLPHIGQLKSNAYFAFGYGGHGAAMASMLGKELAEAIYFNKAVTNPLNVNKLKTIPFHSQHAKGVGAAKLYMRFQDYIS